MKVKKTKKDNITTVVKSSKTLVIASICSISFLFLLTIGCLIYFKQLITMNSNGILGEKYKSYDNYYVMITDGRESSFWKSIYEGAKEEAMRGNCYVEMLGDNLNEDYSVEDLLQIAIDSKVDGIIIESDVSGNMTKLINAANDADIPVVTALGDNSASKRKSFVGLNSYKLGLTYGKQICEIRDAAAGNGGPTNTDVLVLMDDNSDDTSQNIIFSGLQDAIKNSRNKSSIHVETKVISNMGAFAAEESIRDIFIEEKVLPDIIVCMTELNTTCVYQTVVDYNRVGRTNIIGYYDSKTILEAIERNVIYSTVTVNTEQMGMYCVKALNEYKNTGHVSEYFSVDIALINSENVGKYLGGNDESKD